MAERLSPPITHLSQAAREAALVVAKDIRAECRTLFGKREGKGNVVIYPQGKASGRKIIISQEPFYDNSGNPLSSDLTIYVQTPDSPTLESSREAYRFTIGNSGEKVIKESFGGYSTSEREQDRYDLGKLWETITGKKYLKGRAGMDKAARGLLKDFI